MKRTTYGGYASKQKRSFCLHGTYVLVKETDEKPNILLLFYEGECYGRKYSRVRRLGRLGEVAVPYGVVKEGVTATGTLCNNHHHYYHS